MGRDANRTHGPTRIHLGSVEEVDVALLKLSLRQRTRAASSASSSALPALPSARCTAPLLLLLLLHLPPPPYGGRHLSRVQLHIAAQIRTHCFGAASAAAAGAVTAAALGADVIVVVAAHIATVAAGLGSGLVQSGGRRGGL